MTSNLFEPFLSPVLMSIPLILISLLVPWLLVPKPARRWLTSRLLVAQSWSIGQFVRQVFSPLSLPGHKWATLLTCLVIYVMSLNMLGLLPYTFTPTTQLSMNLALALPLWLATVIMGMRNQPQLSLSHLLPMGTPALLIPILISIETISLFIRPISLAVRLTANLTAGHLLIHLISLGIFLLWSVMPSVALMATILLYLLTFLEIAVAMIQAYVFVLLLSLYLQENT